MRRLGFYGFFLAGAILYDMFSGVRPNTTSTINETFVIVEADLGSVAQFGGLTGGPALPAAPRSSQRVATGWLLERVYDSTATVRCLY